MIDLDDIITRSNELAPLPESASKLAGLFGNRDWELDDVAGVVRLDGPLTGRVLGLANSASKGGQTQITNIGQALVRLGPGTVLGLSLGPSARSELSDSLTVYGLSEGDLWRHSVAVALTVEHASRICRCKVPPEAFAAALLHDIGKLVLGRNLGPVDAAYIDRARKEGGQLIAASEEEILGVNHGEVGALVAQHWHLPDNIVQSIRLHHLEEAAPNPVVASIIDFIALGDTVAARMGVGDCEPDGEELDRGVAARLHVEEERLDEICARVSDGFEDVLATYGA